MSERENAKLSPEIQSMVRDVELHLDSRRAGALQHSGLTIREISALQHVVRSSLRGLALRTVSIGKNATWDKELEVLKQVVQLLTTTGTD